MKKNNTIKTIRIVKCVDCGNEFQTERPSVILCDECRKKRYTDARHERPLKSNGKSKEYLNQLSKVIEFRNKSPEHPYQKTMEDKAIEWHTKWLAWAEDNGVANGPEYEITKYALNCIYECKKAREQKFLEYRNA